MGRRTAIPQAFASRSPTFGTTNVEGYVEAALDDSMVDTDAAPSAHLDVELSTLRSGNVLYDAELLRRVEAKLHPLTVVELRETTRMGQSDRYQVRGDLTFHGITRDITGTVSVAVPNGEWITVVGEHVFDIRDVDIIAPTALMLRIYPDVRVQLQLEAEVAS